MASHQVPHRLKPSAGSPAALSRRAGNKRAGLFVPASATPIHAWRIFNKWRVAAPSAVGFALFQAYSAGKLRGLTLFGLYCQMPSSEAWIGFESWDNSGLVLDKGVHVMNFFFSQ